MLGVSWAFGRTAGSVVAAALLAACAAGDGGISGSGNPFTTSPPPPDTEGTGGTDPAPTSGPTDGSASNSNSNSTPGTNSDPDPDPTENPDPDCVDGDGDGHGENCDLGSDCDDADYNNYTPDGCANCVDEDGDDYWVGCDQYGEDKPGPDCDDGNPEVGGTDSKELCNGIAENCAGEIDPLPPDEMCPTEGDAPNVADVGGWKCNMVPPGEDGCEIAACVEGFYDANKVPGDGCECVGTDRTKSLPTCGDDPKGYKGALAEGAVVASIKGVIPFGGEGFGDWYSVDFPEAMAQGIRPNAGNVVVSFSVNPGDPVNPDYRIEVYRACNGKAFDMSLATQFGAGAPPAREWSFFDNHPNPGNPNYKNDVPWPAKVYIRVIRVNNNGSCSEYSLQIARTAN
jgi:hypothetical protein